MSSWAHSHPCTIFQPYFPLSFLPYIVQHFLSESKVPLCYFHLSDSKRRVPKRNVNFGVGIPYLWSSYSTFCLHLQGLLSLFSMPALSILSRQCDALTFHVMNIPLWSHTLKYIPVWMRFQYSVLLISSCVPWSLCFVGGQYQKSPSDPEILLLTQSLLYWRGKERKSFAFLD